SLPEQSGPCSTSSSASQLLARSMRCCSFSQSRRSAMACCAWALPRPKSWPGSPASGACVSHRQASRIGSGRRIGSVLAPFELVLELSRDLPNDQHVAGFVVFDLRAQQVGLEADRQALGTPGEAAELAECAFVRRKFRRHAVILVAD